MNMEVDVAPFLQIWANNTPPPPDKPDSCNLIVFLQFGEKKLPCAISWDRQLGVYILSLVDILSETDCRTYKQTLEKHEYFWLRREIRRIVGIEVTPGLSIKKKDEPMEMPEGLRALQVTLVQTK